MKQINYQLPGIMLITLLSGCSTMVDSYRTFAPDRDTAYLDATASPPLLLPEGVTVADNFHSPYIVPSGPLPGPDAEPISLMPPGGEAVSAKAQQEVERQEPKEQSEDN
ncbi:MAG TPA: hypothetical protein VI522_04515 [Gammaproteobacteria bacterium]|nr:hypothetical protein [Gammaproteobacteria bacterium]